MTTQEQAQAALNPDPNDRMLLANAVLTRDHLRAERDRLQQTLSMTEARLDVVLEMLAMLEGRTEQAARTPRRRRGNSTPADQGILPEQGNTQQESTGL